MGLPCCKQQQIPSKARRASAGAARQRVTAAHGLPVSKVHRKEFREFSSFHRNRRGRCHRHGGDGIHRAAIDELVRIGQVDQRIALGIDHPHDVQAFEENGHALAEDVFLDRQLVLELQGRRHLAAGDGGFRLVLGQADRALHAAGPGTRDVAGHALHLGIIIGFDDHAVVLAQPAEGGADVGQFFGRGRMGNGGGKGEDGEDRPDQGACLMFHEDARIR